MEPSVADRADTTCQRLGPAHWIAVGVALAGAAVAAVIRARLLTAPLERDEGEYAYGGQLLLDGLLPYTHLASMKLPGIYAAYASILAMFGSTVEAIHAGLLVANAAAAGLIFAIALRTVGPYPAAGAAVAFSAWSLGRPVQGLFANAEHFVLPPALMGIAIIAWTGAEASARHRYAAAAASGIAMSVAFLTKQHAVVFVAFGALAWAGSLEWRGATTARPSRRIREAGAYTAGCATPLLLTAIVFAANGALGDLWFWCVQVSFRYASAGGLAEPWQQLASVSTDLAVNAWPLWLLAGGGVLALLFDRQHQRARKAGIALGLLSLVSVFPGLNFRPHYFVLVLPVAALAVAMALSSLMGALARSTERDPGESSPLRQRLAPGAVVSLLIGCAAVTLFGQRTYLFELGPKQLTQATFDANAFPAAVAIGEHIRGRTARDDTVAILGSEPQILFYAQRRSATKYVYMYPLMEPGAFASDMQRSMIREVEAAQPRVAVYYATPYSWMRREDSDTHLLEWFETYQEEHFSLDALVELEPSGARFYRGSGLHWPPRTSEYIAILMRDAS